MSDQDERVDFQNNGKRFNMERRDYFLTYPQCSYPYEAFKGWWNQFDNIEYLIGCIEDHKEGGTHFHVYVCFSVPKKINERTFDICSPTHGDSHPNIGKPKKKFACINYVKKDGDFFEIGAAPVEKNSNGKRNRDRISGKEIKEAAETMTEVEFWVFVADNDINPTMADKLRKAVLTDDIRTIVGYDIPANVELPDDLTCVDVEELRAGKKCLVIEGPSGVGKTVYAKFVAPKPALFVRHIDCLKHLRP